MTVTRKFSRYLLLPATVGLTLVLLLYAVLTYRELEEMRWVYLRSRADIIAARLETLTPQELAEQPLPESLAEEEPALQHLRLYATPESAPEGSALEPIWSGRELSRIEEITAGNQKFFRAYVPFHSQSRLHIARIDLAVTATDFLLEPARHNLLVASVSGLALLILSLSTMWNARRTAQLQKRQLELEHLAQLGQMSAVLAHEIRNPLGTIKGFVQLACEKADGAVGTLLTPVLNEVRRLEKLVSDLLWYGKLHEPVMCLTEWPALAAELAVNAQEAIGDRPIQFRIEGEPCRFETDPDLLKAALLNLIRNSVESLLAAPAGEVRLSASSRPDGALLIAVEDNGPGIAESVKEKLFEPFITTKRAGTGLGLSIARELVNLLGGRLEFLPVNPHGTRAELVFPRTKHAANLRPAGATWNAF